MKEITQSHISLNKGQIPQEMNVVKAGAETGDSVLKIVVQQ